MWDWFAAFIGAATVTFFVAWVTYQVAPVLIYLLK
jgi:hypothetical protein